MPETLEVARGYVQRGWAPIPVPYQSKAPVLQGWPTLRLGETALAQHFNGARQNIGVLLGEPSGGLVDIDLDAPEVQLAAASFLPPTPATFGRASKRQSHRLYKCTPVESTRQFEDIDGTMLIEYRSTGGQTIFPGSVHPSGEPVEWDQQGDPPDTDGRLLKDSVARVAAVALIARHWPGVGSRQRAAMALAGGLLRAGWQAEDVEDFIVAVSTVAGDDEVAMRSKVAEYTCRRVATDQPATGWPTLAELIGDKVVRRACEWLGIKPEEGGGSEDKGRPTIQVNNRFLRDIAADAVQSLKDANDPPRLFVRGTSLVRLVEAGLAAEAVNVPALKGMLDRSADFVKAKEEGDLPARPPDDVVKDILSQQRLPFPQLAGFASTPVFLSGGRLLANNGYDVDSGLYLSLEGLDGVYSDIPMEEAKALLLEHLLVDFPFADEGSKAHAVAALLQPFLRQMIDGVTPLFLMDAPARGTGKGLLADVVSIVVTGAPAYVTALPRDDDETDKRITSVLLAGYPLVLLDNVTALRSSVLAAALTGTLWRGRILGQSRMANVPNLATWFATGNNVEMSDELNRRTVLIRLNAKMEAPEERTGFKHPLPAWAIQHRPELVSACLSIIQHWVNAGMPTSDATLGRFEDWAGVMGGVLGVMGVSGFLSNREQQKGRDPESQEWVALCEAWWDQYQGLPITAKDVFDIAKSQGLLLDLWAGRSELAAQQRMGHALTRRMDRIFGKYQLYSGGEGPTHNRSYRLARAGGGNKTPQTPQTPQAEHETSDFEGGVLKDADSKTPPETPPDLSVNSGVSGVSGVFKLPPAPDENPLDSSGEPPKRRVSI